MSEPKFKAGDCVQLLHGTINPFMNVSKVEFNSFEQTFDVSCHWNNPKTGKPETKDFSEVVLKHCPKKPTDKERVEIRNAMMLGK